MWQNGKKITGLWVIDQNRNGWVYVSGLGWRRLAHGSDSEFLAMMTACAHAKADNRNVNFREVGVGGNIEIHEIYVW